MVIFIYIKKHVPHKIKFKDGTITVLNKFNKNDEDGTEKNVKYSDNHITIIGQNKKISEAYTYVKDGKEWVSAMPRPAKDYEIYDTVKKALECYNNEKSKK